MNSPIKHPARDLGFALTGHVYLPPGDDEVALRDRLSSRPRKYRALKSNEIELMTANGNSAADWGEVYVSDPFNVRFIENCRFFGLVRIGNFDNLILELGGIRLPVGLYNSTIVSCDLGDNIVVDRVAYMAHAIIGDESMLLNIGSLTATPRARFGQGCLFAGEDEAARPRIEVGNEKGSRAIAPFPGMLPADAALWASHPDNEPLCRKLRELTDDVGDPVPGRYNQIGEGVLIRDVHSLTDVHIGVNTSLVGSHRLRDVTILSDEEEPVCIGEGCQLDHGIVGYGCRIDGAAQAAHFVLGTKVNLQSAARVRHTFVGDNSTIACCEIANSLLYPNHEQHHNNSFLIAARLEGQSNIAAGATIGSNHNSRAADGEILARRGFWPGLCTSFKHPSRFAAFTLVAKGDYSHELDIPLPFSLVANSIDGHELVVIPAWWFLYNMYAVRRNEWKFQARDQRIHTRQPIEYDALAPDTAEEILKAIGLLERWVGEAWERHEDPEGHRTRSEKPEERGRELLLNEPQTVETLDIFAANFENSRRPVRLRKVAQGYAIYRDMLHQYAVRVLLEWMRENGVQTLEQLTERFDGVRERDWHNLGAMILSGVELTSLIQSIVGGELGSWEEIHHEYERIHRDYPEARAHHAFKTLLVLHALGPGALTRDLFNDWIEKAIEVQQKIAELVENSRHKDFTLPMRQITFARAGEAQAVLGTMDTDSFIRQERERSEAFALLARDAIER